MPNRRHKPRHKQKQEVLLEGSLFVTGDGEIIVEEALRESRALLCHNTEAIEVKFVGDPECPPCAPIVPDSLSWELFERHHCGVKEIFLKIFWKVSSSRTIVWRVFDIN